MLLLPITSRTLRPFDRASAISQNGASRDPFRSEQDTVVEALFTYVISAAATQLPAPFPSAPNAKSVVRHSPDEHSAFAAHGLQLP